MLSRMVTVEEVRGEPSHPIRRPRSLLVSDFAWGGEEGGGVVAGCVVDCGIFAVDGGAGFFAFLPATCDHSGRAGRWIGLGACVWGAAGTVTACGA